MKIINIFLFTLLSLMTHAHAFFSQNKCMYAVSDSNEAFSIRREMIRSAKEEIILNYYAVATGNTTNKLLEELEYASQRGVKVRMLLDNYSSSVSKEMLKFLEDAKIEVKFYNITRLNNLSKFDRRMHEKYLVIDREKTLTGGRNLKNSYFKERLNTEVVFYDLDVLLGKKVANEIADYFDTRWEMDIFEKKSSQNFDQKKYFTLLTEIYSDDEEINHFKVFDLSILDTIADECVDTQFFAFDPNLDHEKKSIEDYYIDEILMAQESIELVNAYFILTKPLQNAIKDAIKRGVKVKIITNSLESTDVALSYSAFRNLRPKLIRWGVEVFEFAQKDTLHAKVAMFDNKRFIVGSFNLDPRSAYLNSESIILSADPTSTGDIREFIDDTYDLSRKIGKNGRPEGETKRYPGTSWLKRVENFVMRFTLAPLLRARL